ncbi:16S rRNA (uracil(1498)-N(3))-methyltransferase [Globicatella sulfidifaciens]|uniref:Ribosomal RNA small subunit methyltransferase E n=1 Tax=Globicatella sulfidifaciens DSM 15739 TaxID=1121925 RepID=A0A1T4NAV8_9LACT|nr:16S rRNA (uracil(1498)-N(3))-methyltransferase [Globicatella sulfidifaciens]SJZ76420.1 16S rRNA (uracil1498-N3)-methyltransferase [Globicatella sulfidifaciens DSM 15739]
MQRYFIEDSLTIGQQVILDAEITHHIYDVMRGKTGEHILLVDTKQQVYLASLAAKQGSFGMAIIESEIEHQSEFPISEVAIACGLSKNDKLEWIVQKATECGMTQFYPLTLKRDVMKWPGEKATKRMMRLQKIAQEAAEQSHRVQIPTINELSSLKQLINLADDYTIKLIAYEETAKRGQHAQLKEALIHLKASDRLLMVFGSEGGLTPEEVSQLEEAGFICCSLGPRILRAETAPVYFLSALSYQLEL